jgi:cytochrome c-type biogenesis protein CcmE
MRSRKNWQFGAGIVIILATISWLAYSGIQESKTYYVTISELRADTTAQERRLRVAGDVTPGSVQRVNDRVQFEIREGDELLNVVYVGKELLPDTLYQDGAQAVADGRYQTDGTFHAEAIQAKCPSKYEAAGTAVAPDGSKPGLGDETTAAPSGY